MKKAFLLFVLFAAMVSCGKGDEPKPEPKPNPDTPSTQTSITISPSALTFDAQGEAKSVTVTCTTGKTWTLSGGESWCTASRTNGGNGATVTFTAEANTSPDERNATYTFTCGDKTAKLVVTQKQQDALTVTSSKVEVDAQGGPINVEVKANIPFEYVIADKDKGWITPVETKSMQTTILTFNIAQNEDREKREGTITIKSGELSETVTVYQAGGQPTIVITQNTYEVPSKGETIKVEINSNVDYTVSIPEAYSTWIQETVEPKAQSTHTKYFTISINLETQPRTGMILFTSQEHNLYERVSIKQKALSYNDFTLHVPVKGTLSSILVEKELETSPIPLLKITGELNTKDIQRIRDIPRLKCLDISETDLTELSADAFRELKDLQTVILPNTLTSIGERAFEGSGLQSIEIPASVKTIGNSAFKNCTALTTVTFEKGSQLKTIQGRTDLNFPHNYYGVFYKCTSLTSIEIPASVETIESHAFMECTALTTVTFEKGSQLAMINGRAFEKSGLQSIEIPASVKTIGSAAFTKCTALTTVTFEQGSQLDTIQGGNAGYIDYSGAFSDCTSLTSIEIPARVKTIGNTAFRGCTALTTVTFEQGSQLKTIQRSAFYGSGLQSIRIPEYVNIIDYYAFSNCKALTNITFEQRSKLNTIAGYAFSYSGLQSIELPSNVKTIQEHAFYQSNLQSIKIPASVETIGADAFRECKKLTTVTFEPESKLKIIRGYSVPYSNSKYGASGIFINCTSLTSIEIPASVDTIGAAAFQGCKALTTVTFEQGSQLKTINGGYSASTSYYYGAFSDCISLTSIEIPASVETIGRAAFKGCIYNHRTTKTNQKYPSVNL